MTTQFGRARRQPSSKAYISYSEYNYFWYPTYCHGAGYILSNDVALNLYDVTKYVPFLWIDYVYIGFCMSLLGLQITDSFFGFFIDAYDHPLNFLEWCLLKQMYKSTLGMRESWGKIVAATNDETTTYHNNMKALVILTICIVFFKKSKHSKTSNKWFGIFRHRKLTVSSSKSLR